MAEKYDNKNFIVLLKRISQSRAQFPAYLFKFEGYDTIAKYWENSIIASLFKSPSYKEELSLIENTFDTFPVRIIIHSIKDLLVGQSYDETNRPTFGQYFLCKERTKDNNEKKCINTNIDSLIPIIHLTLTNLYSENMYEDNVELSSLIPRSYQIMDSSIWNYIVPINGIPESERYPEESCEERLISVIDSIYNNYVKRLYSLTVAHEYADLNARLALQSYLSGAHASGVAPFIFHSESAIKRMIKEEFYEHKIIDKKTRKSKIEGRNTISSIIEKKWRILLVDDKAVAPMEATGKGYKNDEEFSWNCKLTIIRDLLEKRFGTRGKIHCRTCNDDVKDYTLSINFLKKSICVNNIDICMETNGIKLFKDKINSLITQAVTAKAKDIQKDRRIRWKAKETSEIVCDVLPIIGQSLEGYKFYFNKKAIDYNINLLIQELLSQTFKDNSVEIKEGCPTTSNIVIEYAQNVDEAEKSLKKKKYDIILLDYLINNENGKQYGYKVLNDIYRALKDYKTNYEQNKEGYKVGPARRYFFIFISAYSSAVYERLLAEGLNRSEKYWHIAVGACPTNTPQLFLYNLIKLMEKRLDDSGVDKLCAKGIFDVINRIFRIGDDETKEKPVRLRANMYYQEILDMHYLFKKMLNDVQIPSQKEKSIFDTSGSVLMTDFISQNVNLGGFLEHLIQLVHLTAFGTVRQWPEMWEEYIYFKAQFNVIQFREECKILHLDADEKFNNLCISIEHHILSLKSD